MAEQSKTQDARIKLTTDKQAELLKGAFKDNEDFLKSVRNLFFGLKTTEEEKKLIQKVFKSEDLRLVFRKKCYPIFEEDTADIPVNSIADFWGGVENNVFGQTRDTIYQNVNSKMMICEYLDKAVKLLSDPWGPAVDLNFTPSEHDPLQVKLLARNLYIRTIIETMNFIQIICAQKDEKPQETKKKRNLDSVE